MAKKIGLGLLGALVLLIIVIATRPTDYSVERSISVSAPPETVFPWVCDLTKFPEWSPWEKLDPKMSKSFAGTACTVGQSYDWSGNDEVGKGNMKLTQLAANENATLSLEFFEPFQSKANTALTLASENGGTRVTWSMSGKNNFMAKAVGLFIDMEGMIGASYDEGLAMLKSKVEAGS